MATFRKRCQSWQVQVRRDGHPTLSRTFRLKQDAELWARQIETEIDRTGLPVDRRTLQSITFCDLITRYESQITPRKRGERAERYRLAFLRKHSISGVSIARLSAGLIAKYRNERAKSVGPQTVRHELNLIRHIITVARREWDLPLASNPAVDVTPPQTPEARDRRLMPGELDALLKACRRNKHMPTLIQLAIETAMRRGELLNIRADHIDFDAATLLIPEAKNGYRRIIPLTPKALALLRAQPVAEDGRLFPLAANALRLAWERIKGRAKVDNLHFHDLRHEAISRFFEKGLSVPEVALISGHRDPRMLFRYTHLRAEDVAKKLA